MGTGRGGMPGIMKSVKFIPFIKTSSGGRERAGIGVVDGLGEGVNEDVDEEYVVAGAIDVGDKEGVAVNMVCIGEEAGTWLS
jgi:hypothetical protein